MKVRPFPTRKPRDDELDVFGVSHAGKVRKENQDHYLIATFHRRINVLGTNLPDVAQRLPSEEQRMAYVVMVADGVGGGVGGAEASATALEAAMRYVHGSVTVYYGADADEDEFKALLQEAAMRAHEAVRSARAEQGSRGEPWPRPSRSTSASGPPTTCCRSATRATTCGATARSCR